MKKRSFYSLTLLSVLVFALIPRGARAQATPTATATPPPVGCVINQGQLLPNGLIADCHTGGTAPSSLLGISGGNINSITIDKTGNVACCSGTFGALVVDASPGATPTPPYGYVLSTNHTLARTSGPKSAKAKEEIVQPGLADLGCWQDQTDTVAELSRWTKISFTGAKNELDAAIAKVVLTPQTPGGPLLPGIDQTGFIKNIGQISTTPFPWANLVDNMPVMKMGRTSCLSTGVIAAFDAIGLVSYDATCNAASSGVAHLIIRFWFSARISPPKPVAALPLRAIPAPSY